jgi:hypothetical protein
MIPQILQMAFGKQSTAEPAVDGGANASKTGSYNGTGSSFTITGLQTTGNDNVIVAAFSVLTNTGLTAARTISSISGYATSWTLVQRRSFNFTGASTFTNTEEVWIGKIAASAAAADVTVTMSGTVSDHVAYNLKSFNNIDQTNTTDAVGGGQNGTTTPNSTSVNLTSPYAKGVELSIIQTPNAFTPAVTTSGFSEQDASGAKLATSRISQAWKLYSGAAPTSDPVSWGTQQQYNLETLVLRASGQLSQPTTAPSFVNGGSTGAGSNINLDLQVGDFIVMNALCTKANGAAPTVTSPSGVGTWTRLGGASIINSAGHGLTHEVWYTRATSAGIQSVGVSYSAAPTSQITAVEIWQGVNTTEPFASTLFLASGASANWNGGQINVLYANSAISVALGTTAQGGSAPGDTGWTEWGQVASGPTPQACQDHWYRAANAGNYTFNWGAETNVVFCGYALKGTGGGS